MDPTRLDELVPLYDPTTLPRVLSRSAAVQLGYTRAAIEHQLRTGRWRRVLPRTYLTSGTLTWDDRTRASLIFAGEEALLSGAAALADLRLRCIRRPETLLVLVPRSVTARSTAWVRIRRTDRMPEPALIPGPRRAHLARAVADLALELQREDDVRALVAETVRAGHCSVDELAVEYRSGPRRNSRFLRCAIDEVGGGAWSAPEARAATLLRRARILLFEQNARIELSNGRVVIVDFCWPQLKAVLEIDSDAHHAIAGDADRTSDRHLWLQTDGYSVIHRTPRQIVTDPTAFVQGVRSWLAGRAAELRR